jgi:hypothetical protein
VAVTLSSLGSSASSALATADGAALQCSLIDATYWLNTPAQDLAEVHRIVESVLIERGS